MKNFIEVTRLSYGPIQGKTAVIKREGMTINIAQISHFYITDDDTNMPYSKTTIKLASRIELNVAEFYDEIKQMIEEASK